MHNSLSINLEIHVTGILKKVAVATLILVSRKLKSLNQQKAVAEISLNLSTCKFILAHGTWLTQMWYGNSWFSKIIHGTCINLICAQIYD
ncbi:hypothetical protein B296_00021171 [Ensete ventricosum]|uniref:Uncharacterized protein n=1 Tax=Ensete ventricosum TaxID=4639 RepID=A0A426ZI92_ENSVE|nr:hypothetical protein B296_00021171 [Ensete ventricosum]